MKEGMLEATLVGAGNSLVTLDCQRSTSRQWRGNSVDVDTGMLWSDTRCADRDRA